MIAETNVIRQGNLVVRVPSGFFARWYLQHRRVFPWRKSHVSPFGIVLAEILLKQTKAEMVSQVWISLMKRYPSARELATADTSELFTIVAGLGFGHQRTKALIDLASAIVIAGRLPSQVEELLKLPHMGVYAAHAVACFGFGQRVPVVDLNVIRIFSRLAGVEPMKDIRRAPQYWDMAQDLLPKRRYVEHNYGLLDFAATVCKARSPQHNECPIAKHCVYVREVIEDE